MILSDYIRVVVDNAAPGTEVSFDVCVEVMGGEIFVVRESFNRISFKLVKK